MVEAEKAPTTPNLDFPRPLLDAVAWVVARGFQVDQVWQAFQDALIWGRIRAGDQKGRNHFQKLNDYRQDFSLRGATQEDLDAISALGRGFAIPPLSWRKWVADRSLSRETGKVIRDVVGRLVVFEPILEGIDVLYVSSLLSKREPTDRPASTAGANQAPTKTPTVSWITAEVRRMKDAGEIPNDISITDFAKLLARRMREAARTDASVRPVTWQHVKNELPGWDLWPVLLIKN